jgi:hypothetical protein
MWFIHNLGTMGLIILSFPILVFFELILRPFKNTKKLVEWQQSLSKTLYWNFLIRILLESYMIVIVCALINMTDLDFSNTGRSIISSSAIFFASVCVVLPFFTYFFLRKNFHRLAT